MIPLVLRFQLGIFYQIPVPTMLPLEFSIFRYSYISIKEKNLKNFISYSNLINNINFWYLPRSAVIATNIILYSKFV